jgi:phage tail-like protein
MTDAELQPTYHWLDAVSGWQLAASKGIRIGGDGTITLERLPGAARAVLTVEAMEQAGLQCAAGLTADGCGMAWVVDVATARIFQIDLHERRVQRIDALGGVGEDARQFRQPRALAALPNGQYAVADTGNHRVQVFSRAGLALTRLLDSSLQEPVGLATDACSHLYIADREQSVVWSVARNARAIAMGRGDLVEPLRVSVAVSGIVAVADRGGGAVWLFEPGAEHAYGRLTIGEQLPYSVAFDADGTLYVGDGIGLVHVFARDDSEASGYRKVGAGDTRITGEILDLAWVRSVGLLGIIREDREGNPRTLWTIDPQGACTTQGWLVTNALNSRVVACQWHRVQLRADFIDSAGNPDAATGAASIGISTFTSDDAQVGAVLLAGNCIPWRAGVTSGEPDPDALVQSDPGQYLWLRLELRSNGVVTPRIAGANVHFPRSGYLQHLPAVYQDDRSSRLFLERFLALFQSEFDALDRRIDRMWLHFDPASIERPWLLWLSQWVGLVIDPEWSEAQLRQRIKQAHATHLVRGTPAGLKRAIADYTGVQASVLEHFKLREWTVLADSQATLDRSKRLWNSGIYGQWQLDVYSRLGEFQLVSTPEPAIEQFHWGAHCFTVFFSAEAADVADVLNRVMAVVEREKPAHTRADYCPVLPRMRVGRQSMVGVDTRVGGVSPLALNRMATLGYDSVLGCSPPELAMGSVAAVPRSRVGASARLH